jgi:hypothetical protein
MDMNMKKTSFVLGLAALLVAGSAAAQTASEIEIDRAMMETERKAIVAKNMILSEEEADAFWPVYNDYREAVRPLTDKRVKLIRELAAQFETLGDDVAQDMLKENFSQQQARLKLKRSYIGKFNKVLAPKKTVRLFQIENKLDAIIDFGLAKAIPLVE